MRVSTETTKEKEARGFLKDREGRAVAGEPVLPRASKVRYEEARDDLKRHYKTTGSRGLEEAGWRFDHLDGFFAGRRLANITGAIVSEYIARRQGEKAANGTINRELGVLVKVLRLAYDYGKLMRFLWFTSPRRVPRVRGSSSPSNSRRCGASSPMTSRSRPRSPTRSAGVHRAKCSPSSAGSSTSRRAPFGWIPAPRRTMTAGSSISRRSSRRS